MLVKTKLLSEEGRWGEGGRQNPCIYSSEKQLKPWMKILGKDCVIPSVSHATLKTNYEFETEGILSSQLLLPDSKFKTNEPSGPRSAHAPVQAISTGVRRVTVVWGVGESITAG